jgi:RNA polymerase sigma-70 factor, ECF subfamily
MQITTDNLSKEKGLLILAKNGDLAAFEKILSQYEKAIFNHLYRLVGRREDAEDLTQKTFIKLYRSIKTIDLEKNFKAWLYKIATNTAYDWLRIKKREATFLSDDIENCAETIDAEDTYYSIERLEDLERALNKIKPAYKSILLLCYKDCLAYQEIAEVLNIPINTVKTHIYRAKQALKNELKIYDQS